MSLSSLLFVSDEYRWFISKGNFFIIKNINGDELDSYLAVDVLNLKIEDKEGSEMIRVTSLFPTRFWHLK